MEEVVVAVVAMVELLFNQGGRSWCSLWWWSVLVAGMPCQDLYLLTMYYFTPLPKVDTRL